MFRSLPHTKTGYFTQAQSKSCLRALKYTHVIPWHTPACTNWHTPTKTHTHTHTPGVPEKLQSGSAPVSTQQGQSSVQLVLQPSETLQLFKLGSCFIPVQTGPGFILVQGQFSGVTSNHSGFLEDKGWVSRARHWTECSSPIPFFKDGGGYVKIYLVGVGWFLLARYFYTIPQRVPSKKRQVQHQHHLILKDWPLCHWPQCLHLTVSAVKHYSQSFCHTACPFLICPESQCCKPK